MVTESSVPSVILVPTSQSKITDSGTQQMYIIGGIIGLAVIVLMISIAVCVIKKRRSGGKLEMLKYYFGFINSLNLECSDGVKATLNLTPLKRNVNINHSIRVTYFQKMHVLCTLQW